MKRLLSFLVALFLATTALWAYDLMWDDMFYDYSYYNYDPYTGQYADTTLTVVSTPYDSPLKNRTSIVIPAEVKCGEQTFPVTEIGGGAFKGYEYLESITIPNTIKRIGSSAFYNCESLTSINLPNSITEIGGDAFRDCKNLTSIVIPDSVTTIESYTFYGCESLSSITFPKGLTTIEGPWTFDGCASLTSVTIPENVTMIGTAFYTCKSLSSVVWNPRSCEIDEQIFGTYNNKCASPITSFVFGNYVEFIPKGLCCGMDKLTSVTIPNSVTTIGSKAFNGCTSLRYINIPSSVTTIGSGSKYDRFFEGVMNGKVCKIDANLVSDDVRLFVNCKFDSMIIGASVTTLNAYAFFLDPWDGEIYHGSDIYFESATPPTILNKDAGLGDIVYVHVPAGAKAAYHEALGDNYVFLEPNESRTITGTCGEHLTYTLEPTTGDLTILGHGDMYDYKATYPKTTSPFYRYRNLIKNITFPEGITSIGEYAFYQCPYPQNHITLPQSLQQIKQYALCFSPKGKKEVRREDTWYYYYDNAENVTEIQVGSNISYIGDMAFSEAVTTISCAATTPPALYKSYYSTTPATNLLLVRCPRGTSAAYRAAWGDKYIYAEEGMADTTGILVNDVKWALNFYTRTLSITGKGEMPNFKDTRKGATTVYAPWEKYSVLIDSVYIGDSITYIGNCAFEGFARLQSLTVPKGVVAVGYEIAAGTNLQTVYINASLQDANASIASGVIGSPIGDWIVGDGHTYFTFDDTKLANVHFADGITSIAPRLFLECDSIRSIVIPNSVKTIGRNAFEACRNLTSIQLPNSLEVIDTACFASTTRLKHIDIPKTVTKICANAFSSSGITDIDLPEGITVIEANAFRYTDLTSIHLPNSLQELGTEVFTGVEIDTLVIPENVTRVGSYITGKNGEYAEQKPRCLKLLVWNAKNAINTACGIDEIYCGYKARMFETDKIIIGDSVEYIPNAFVKYNYPSLTIPDKVQKIGHDAFSYMKTLPDTIYVGTGLTLCGNSAFGGGTAQHIFIKDIKAFCSINLYDSESSLFYGSNALSQLYINGRNVNDLGKIIIPDDVTSIHSVFHYYDFSNTEIVFGKNVAIIERYAFYGSTIRALTMNDDIFRIGYNALMNCNIGTLTVGASVESCPLSYTTVNHLVWNARNANNTNEYGYHQHLQSPESLYSVTFGDSVLRVPEGLCYGATYLQSVHIPDNVISVGEQAFYGCSSLSDLSLSASLSSVGKEAFSGCNQLSSLTFRERCSLDSKAFYNCTGLQHIYCHSEIPGTCASDAFDGLDKFACTLHVPAGSQPKYQVATGWRDFYYTEEIGAKEIAVSVTASNDRYGAVTLSGTGTYHDGDQITLTATPYIGYTFLLWSDGVFANPRTITLTHDTTLVAYFDPLSNETRYVTVTCDPAQGEVTGGGEYYLNTEATLTAVPAAGYRFVRWSDGNTDNPRMVAVEDNATYTAEFAINRHSITVIYDTQQGVVTGAGMYDYGTQVTLTAVANKGYEFAQWSNGVTDNPYLLTATADLTLEAQFVLATAVDNVSANDTTPQKIIRDGQVYILRNGKTYTLTGVEVK